MQSRFPFVAVVGQNQLKTALLLNTVDPSIGGLLVSGPRGSAKTTLVRSITDLGPDKAFVNVPLGASEEMVTGSFDLEKALADSELAFRPGLLSQADGGMLYVDEVNLLADHLVDLLLDCAASGINHVERDGISHSHEARFSLVGTMNPDEGELRPQLLDRFGMSCAVQTAFSPVERQEIVARRLAFDDDADEFRATWLAATDQVTRELADAVALLPTVSVSEEMSREIALRCQNANVEGFRADITMHRAAKAHAALHGRSAVNTEDLEAVENLVLDHRRKPGPDNRQDPASGNQDTSAGSGGSSIQGSRSEERRVGKECC